MIFRPARSEEQTEIRRLVRAARLNPFDLNWRRFWVAAEEDGRLLAVGQIRQHRDGSRELASIVSVPQARGRGVASALIRTLLALETGPVYLTCRPELVGFYRPLGFEPATPPLPAYFRRIAWLSGLAERVTRRPMVAILRQTGNQ